MASLIQLWRLWIFQVMVTNTTNAFYLSMVGSTSDVTSRGSTNHIGNSNNIRRLSKTSISQTTNSAAQSFDLSSGLISQLAVVAIRSRLRSHTSVACDVTARNNGLIFGSFFVGPCTVKGTGWQSGLGLTCRAIEATVAECELDKSRVVADRKLVLKQPSKGKAMIALDKNDFGNFLAHPLIRPPSIKANESVGGGANNLLFLRDGVSIDPVLGTVNFYALLHDKKWNCSLRRGDRDHKRAIVEVTPTVEVECGPNTEELSSVLSEEITTYFNDILFELDGTFLTFKDMMITDKGASPSVMFKMGITVEKFPSRNLAF